MPYVLRLDMPGTLADGHFVRANFLAEDLDGSSYTDDPSQAYRFDDEAEAAKYRCGFETVVPITDPE